MHLGRVDEARLALQRAIEFDPSFQSALNDLSILESNVHRFDQSLYWARRAFPLAPNVPYSHYHVGVPLVWLDEAVAERWLLTAESHFPRSEPGAQRLQVLLAILDFRRGKTAAALERMRRAVAAEPANAEGALFLTELAGLAGADDAEMIVDQLFKESPDPRGWISPHTARTWRAYLWMKAASGRGQFH